MSDKKSGGYFLVDFVTDWIIIAAGLLITLYLFPGSGNVERIVIFGIGMTAQTIVNVKTRKLKKGN